MNRNMYSVNGARKCINQGCFAALPQNAGAMCLNCRYKRRILNGRAMAQLERTRKRQKRMREERASRVVEKTMPLQVGGNWSVTVSRKVSA